jgi:hypothetical protein
MAIEGDVPSTDAPVGGEAMESILAGGERAKNGGDADKALSVAAAAAVDAAAAAAATDVGALAVLADRLSA